MENARQPLDEIMTRHGLSNADLVNASTEQLSFKQVSKGRSGRRLTPNIQEKILTALTKAKPELKSLRRRDLFRYDIGGSVVESIHQAAAKALAGEVDYPGYVDLLAEAGITRYSVDVAAHRILFYGVAGEAHTEQGAVISESAPGPFDTVLIRKAIGEAQKRTIDYPTFLRKIHAAGVGTYEVNIRQRKIDYRGDGQSYRESIPVPGAPLPAPKAAVKKEAKKPAKKKKPQRRSMTTKARMSYNKRYFTRQRKKRR